MSLQVKLGGNTATLYGTLFDSKDNWIPISFNGSSSIATDGLLVVQPYYRYYKMVLNRTNSNPVKAYFYVIKNGAFLVNLDGSSLAISDGEFDKIRKGTQTELNIDASLTNTNTLFTKSFSASAEVYLVHSLFSSLEQGGALLEVDALYGATTRSLGRYVLTGEQPTIIDAPNFLDKIDHASLPLTIRVSAKKMIYNWPTQLYGRLTFMIR
jgi:hypothetical protein